MRRVRVLWCRLRALLVSRAHDRELADEIQSHLAEATDDYTRQGLSPEEARRAALRSFGGVVQTAEAYRDRQGFPVLDACGQDVRYAVRTLVKSPGFTLVTVLTLSLAIGASTALFTIVNAELLRDLPLPDPGRIVALGTRDRQGREQSTVSYRDAQDWSAATQTLRDVALFSQGPGTLILSGDGHAAERYVGPFISANTFQLLRVQPILGRDLGQEDDVPGAPSVVVLGYSVWKARYGADPSVVGQALMVNGEPAIVIGVMPEGMQFPGLAELWMPLAQLPGVRSQPRDTRTLVAFGRLADGVTLGQARAEFATMGRRLALAHPDTNAGVVPTVSTFHDRFTSQGLSLLMYLLLAAMALALLIACVNVANLMLARAAGRARELALRASLGATRWRIVRQLMVESALLAAMSSVVGLAVTLLGVKLVRATFAGAPLPFWVQFGMDEHVFLFFLAVCGSTLVLFGLAPAWHISGIDLNDVLKEGGHAVAGPHVHAWSSTLIVVDLALTLALLAGAGLLTKSFIKSADLQVGSDPSRVLTMQLELPSARYRTGEQRITFFEALHARLRAIGNIESATVASHAPIFGGFKRQLTIEGQPLLADDHPPDVTMVSVGPSYFATLGLTLLRGRPFTEIDGAPGQASAIINQRLAALLFPDTDPIGRRVRLSDTTNHGPWLTSVGIAPTVRQRNIVQAEADPVVYQPYRAEPVAAYLVALRSRTEPSLLTSTLRDAVRALDPNLPLFDVQTLNGRIAQVRWNWLVAGSMFGILAGIAVVLSAVGLYAVVAYAVTQRTREIAIRMALGAQPHDVWTLIGRSVGVRVVIGLVIGLAMALAIGRLMRSLLLQTSPTDVGTLLLVSLIMVLISLTASCVPARRAVRIEPTIALRAD
jgi:putative ABC transport system permease protein